MHWFQYYSQPYFVGTCECCNKIHDTNFKPTFRNGLIHKMPNPTIHSSTIAPNVQTDYIVMLYKVVFT